MFRISKYLILVALGIITFTESLCLGKVVGVADVVVDGVVLVSARTPDGYEVVAGVNLHLGTSTSRLGDAGDYPPQNADDWDFLTKAANDYPLTWVFGGIWRDTNGAHPDFFIFEAAGSREVTYFRALFPDGSMGEPLVVPTEAWLDTGVVADQMIAGLAFSITDLKDTSGNDLPINAEIQGLVVGPLSGTSGNVDPVVIAAVMIKELAYGPTPADGQTDVPRDVVLSWTQGIYADKHDVYFGASFDNVNNASRDDPLGVLVSQGHDVNTYDPLAPLEFSQTYYWRIDEVNAAPDYTLFKGAVWSFTVEPFAYTIAGTSINATASSSNAAAEGPENTINGSGLDADDLHSEENKDMWLSSIIGPQPTWIQYEFDRVYKLHELWVWNHNTSVEPVIGFGVKDATIEYSTDGTNWTTLGTTHEFTRAPGAAGYAHNTTVDLSGVVAKYIKITANSNWGGIVPQFGLSEVRFLYIPVLAREPAPASGAADVDVDAVLSWRTGREAASHKVYISSDEQAVIDETAAVTTVTEASYGPLSLDLGQSYYWKVNEVNEAETPTTWQGDVWNFSTQEYLVVDDFEDYNDFEPDRIFDTWVDGWGIPANGSQVGSDMPPFAELTIVHGGKQSMPLHYDNSTASYSEATANIADLVIGQDWTKYGIQTLVLYFHGTSGNTGQLYVKLNNSKVVYDGDAADMAKLRWKQWNIELASFGVNLQNVTTLSIGIDGSGAGGTLYLDDIGLYRLAPEPHEEIFFEAESADTITPPMQVYDDPLASGGKYIAVAPGIESTGNPPADGHATYVFTVTGGVYEIIGRVIAPTGDEDSFWVRIEVATTQTTNHASGWVRWNGIPVGTQWHWDDVHSSEDNDTAVQFTMPAGTYTLEIAYREQGALLDVIVISKLD